MLKNCLFGTYRASATTTFVFSIVSRYPATIRIDNATSAQSSGAPLSQLRAEEERLRNSRRNCDPVHLYLPSTVQEIAVSSHAAPASCAMMNSGASAGRIPANVSDNDLAMVTAGLANDVDAVNQ